MRIGIDARELCGRATGAGRYLAGLLAEWASRGDRRHEFVLYAPEALTGTLDAHRFATRIIPGAPGTWWEQVRLPQVARTDHLDVFFSPAYSTPLSLNVPVVVAIHDVSFVVHAEWFRTREGIRRRWLTRESARRASGILTISEFTRSEIAEHLAIAPSRVQVVPPGVTVPPVRQTRDGRERVLFVGSIFNRRHVPDLIRAFAELARRRPQASLDLVGDNRTYPWEDVSQAIEAQGLTSRVRWHRYASDEQLQDLYAGAAAFAFLSEYEGLGLTPLEALAAGVPSVLLDTPVARESCGETALYVARGDIAGTTAALERLLTDEDTRTRLLSAAPAVLARYQWPRAADDTLAALEAASRADLRSVVTG